MTRKTTNTRAKPVSKAGKAVPGAAKRSEEEVNTTETPEVGEAHDPESWRNEGGSGEVQ